MSVSVVIPVHNGGDDFLASLEALRASSTAPDEIIMVDDSSTDASAASAIQAGAKVVTLAGGPFGPAAARNQGVESACGEIIVFIDADVAVHPDTLALILAAFEAYPQVSALFGSYDDTPQKRGLVSRYKNLQHHYVHQNSQREAFTFWAGCGAIRRDAFLAVGGFSLAYPRPSIEDIELGLRLHNAGHLIYLCPDVQVTHLKRWTLLSLLRSDIRDRAIPWTKLILSSSHLPADLNLDWNNRLSAAAAWLAVFFLAASLLYPLALAGLVLALAAQLALNFSFYRMFARREGVLRAVGAFGLHWLYFIYSSAIFAAMLTGHCISKKIRKFGISSANSKTIRSQTKINEG